MPNTLIAVSPYVGRVALAALPQGADLAPALKEFAEAYSFSPSQIKNASKTVVLLRRKFGVAVLPVGADAQGRTGIRLFEHERFEVVYMEGVMNILEAILRLHAERGTLGAARSRSR